MQMDYVVEKLEVVTLDIAREDGLLAGHDLMSPYVWKEKTDDGDKGRLRLLVRVLKNPLGAQDPTGVIYAGTYMTEALVESFFADELRQAGVAPLLDDKPAGVEVSLREGPKGRLLFVLNTTHEPVGVSGVPAGKAVVGDAAPVGGRLDLPAYGCAVLQLE